MGINVHTVQFRPELYRPVARHLRNYHPVEWDLGSDVNHPTTFPFARNRVNWDDLYGTWAKAGYTTIASLMFETLPPQKWAGHTAEAEAYGAAFGAYQARVNTLGAVEIGNEPGEFSDAAYTVQFVAMARGLRRTAPKLPIATCAIRVGPSGRYHKSVETVREHLDLVDVLTVHTYSEAEPWPTFRRAHPEDAKALFLQPAREVLAWRDRHAPGKPVWVTEFGWDASTKTPDPGGEWAKWVGNSETEQAQWLVRAWLEFGRMGVQRAYQFWFNDDDQAQMHGSSGLTRGYAPKPAFYAAAHLRRALGPYRFGQDLVRQEGKVYAAEWVHATDATRRCWVVWVPTREGAPTTVTVPGWRGKVLRSERMPLGPGPAASVPVRTQGGRLNLVADGSPVLVFGRR